MILEFKYQERYSRGELLLRTILGFFYLILPHALLLGIFGIAAAVLQFLAFWVILFTGRYPESWFEFQVKYMRWNLRLTARIFNLADGYPAFGLNATDDNVTFEVPYPEKISRGLTLVRGLFGFIYVMIPHGIILSLLNVAVSLLSFIAFFAILFTGKHPKGMFDFVVYFLRWNQRVSLYLGHMTDTYPPFSGDPDPAPATPEETEASAQEAPQEPEEKKNEDPGRFMPPSSDDKPSDGDDNAKGDETNKDDTSKE